ncbi:bleomycin resistance protein [Kocuria aegyptia]|uniref:Uncharacterized protein n=1 Tax=Kocuria aegyptia TaxID=330943 RepID=A0ABN2KHC4_9MICC
MTGHELFPLIDCADLLDARALSERVSHAVRVCRFPEEEEPVGLVLGVGDGRLRPGVGASAALHGNAPLPEGAPLPATGHAVGPCVGVEDLPAVVEAASRPGSAVPVRARAMPWRETVACARDPEGAMLLVARSGRACEGPAS